MVATKKETSSITVIPQARICQTTIRIQGTAPYVQHKFSAKSRGIIQASHEAGSAGKSKKKKEARDFVEDGIGATHYSTEGWVGIPAPAFRNAMIDACRTVGVKMTNAKMAAFIIADGVDKDDGTPLVRLVAGDPEYPILAVRNQTGVVDLRCRPMWKEWSASVTVEFDEDMLDLASITNLLDRAGKQVGVGEGRPFSKNSCGQGWGTFKVVHEEVQC